METFLSTTAEEVAVGRECVEAGDVVIYSIVHRNIPHNTEISNPKYQ